MVCKIVYSGEKEGTFKPDIAPANCSCFLLCRRKLEEIPGHLQRNATSVELNASCSQLADWKRLLPVHFFWLVYTNFDNREEKERKNERVEERCAVN